MFNGCRSLPEIEQAYKKGLITHGDYTTFCKLTDYKNKLEKSNQVGALGNADYRQRLELTDRVYFERDFSKSTLSYRLIGANISVIDDDAILPQIERAVASPALVKATKPADPFIEMRLFIQKATAKLKMNTGRIKNGQ
ncbi:MAG: hypothetical protein ABIX01_11875 [Chitinophagaceae bacterium]